VITGEAYGSAYVSMNSKHIGADLVLALDSAKVGVMDAKVAAQILCEDEISQAANTKKHWKKRQKSLIHFRMVPQRQQREVMWIM